MLISMTQENYARYETSLLALRDQLSHEIKEVIKDADMGSDVDHGDEEADEAEERGAGYASQIVLKERLHAVLDALLKIKNGTYGICETCGETISADVLDASPESRQCKACKTTKAR